MEARATLHQGDWSLHRRGPMDDARHREKLKDAIKGNLSDIASAGDIISGDGQKTVKVPLKGLDLPRFRHKTGKEKRTGQGDGGTQVGDVVGIIPDKDGSGRQAGTDPGQDVYLVEITVDDLADLLFESLQLPRLLPKKQAQDITVSTQFTDVRRKGVLSNLDKKKTLLENLKRNAQHGIPHVGNVSDDDLRFKVWDDIKKPHHRAVVFAMRDVSGSMGDFEQWVSRCCYFWMARFLRKKYQQVEIVFITHHTEAKEVSEHDFFHLAESGGTTVSSAYKLAQQIVRERYPEDSWNVYMFHFSDGDNYGSDNEECRKIVEELLPRVNLFGYAEISAYDRGGTTPLSDALASIKDKRFVRVEIADRSDVTKTLKDFFREDLEDTGA